MVTILVSGQHRTWKTYRWIHVCKFCRKALVRGISKAMDDEQFEELEVKIGGKIVEGCHILNDKVYFPDLLEPTIEVVKKQYFFGLIKTEKTVKIPGCFYLEVKVKYLDMEGPVYS